MAQRHQPRKRPNRRLRPVYNMPVWLYRLGPGWLLGRWLTVIVHRGRKTGKRRYVRAEILRHDKGEDEYIALSGYGEGSDWYWNIREKPALEIRVGRRGFVSEQRFLTGDEVYDEFVAYEKRRRWAAVTVAKHQGMEYDGSEEHAGS